ncbi:MAG TPA: nitroreductase family protein, partial [Thermoanaerobaculia bacterium]
TQVKISGHRVELGEIESALERHPRVRSAVAAAVGPRRGPRRLVAYVVPRRQRRRESLAVAPASLLDPDDKVAQLDWKLAERGIRHDLAAGGEIRLEEPALDEALARSYDRRRSVRSFLPRAVSFASFSRLLAALRQVKLEDFPLPKYRFPSAGHLYPVQTYVWTHGHGIEGVAAGAYYYHPREHRLVPLSGGVELPREIFAGDNRPVFDLAAFTLFLVAELRASSPLYPELARDFALLEAGYMSQLLMATAAEEEIGLCPIGDLSFAPLRAHLLLDDSQVLLHSHLGGHAEARPDRPRIALPAALPELAAARPAAPVVSTALEDQALVEELQSFARSVLPSPLIPASWVVLEDLPLSATGKVDRRALPAPEPAAGAAAGHQEPRDATERLIAELWRELLRVPHLGIHDNFFEVGGDSVLAVRFIARAAQSGLVVSSRQLFEFQTVAGLGAAVAAARAEPLPQQQPAAAPAAAVLNDEEIDRLMAELREVGEADVEPGATAN